MAGKPLLPLGLRCRPGSPFIQYLAIKAHDQLKGGVETGAALFVSGLPPSLANEGAVRELFSCFGPVAQAVLHPSKRSGMVVFESQAGRLVALRHAAKGQVVEFDPAEPQGDEPIGVKAWVHQHKALRPGNDVLQEQVDSWIEAHDVAEAAKAKARQAAMAEDGWTVVVRSKGRKRTREEDGMTVMTGGASGAAAQAQAAAASKKGSADQQLSDFYRFQRREKRRNELFELRERFEEDRKRIAQLKALRNFRPS